MYNELLNYLSYPFIRYALAAGVLIALCSSLLGVPLVLKRYSFIGDGLSHIAFGALAIATILRINNDMIIVLPVTVIAAILILCANRKIIKGDAILAMISVSALALGYLFLNIFPTSSNVSGDVCSTLFGSTSILTLSTLDVWLCIIMSIIVISVFTLLYDKLFAVTFDEGFAAATGINVKFYNTLISVITAIIIVLAMNLAGSLLTSALIVFPAVSAMQLCKSFKSLVIFSAVLAIVCAFLGIMTAFIFSTPVGATVVVIYIIAFALCCSAKKILRI